MKEIGGNRFMSLGLVLLLLLLLGARGVLQAQTSVKEKEERYQSLLEQYFTHYERGQNDSAEVVLQEALALLPEAPTNFMLRGNLAELMLARRDTVAALSELSQAIREQPEVAKTRERRATILEEMGRYSEALVDLDYLVELLPQNEVPRYNRARVFESLELYEAASADLRHIIHQNEEAYLPRVALSKVLEKQGKVMEAERLLVYLQEKFPKIPNAYREQARLLLRQERKAEALDKIRHVINEMVGQRSYEDHIIRGQILLRYGEQASAERDFEEAKRLGATDKYIEIAKREVSQM